jgi:hypothetical protein
MFVPEMLKKNSAGTYKGALSDSFAPFGEIFRTRHRSRNLPSKPMRPSKERLCRDDCRLSDMTLLDSLYQVAAIASTT